ncbi:M48 family metalloprotease [Myxococcus sp. AM011]|uniref:M48 family metallopeptidase n=1 Tax=Myxococcus sp. AM011 TaxID=2745200 RepID=UPI001594EB94|nr:M48 family metallopeptidase [Myxococcus sp. AM011]NVJ26376.1 M48 family metalloprotease [Myxococcus sp. AM011]
MRPTTTAPGFLRSYVLPALWLFALPLFGLWFTGHATASVDGDVLESIEKQVSQDTELTEEQRAETLAFFRAVPASAACLSTDEALANFRSNLAEVCKDVKQFDWMHSLASGLLALGLATTVIALLCGLAAFVSRPFQFISFVVGWNVLRVTGALQAIGQGGLAVWLSYWVTALWFNRYSPKLIGVVGILVAMAIFLVVVAIFRRPPMDFEVEAEVLEESKAPELWAHVRRLCARLDTPPPDHILAGIDANFFVTESDVRVGGQTLSGRTLYVSLSLLRLLEQSEADAVLAHEMGHLLGGDTGHGKRLAPRLAHFAQYLQTLHEGGLTRPIYHFMLAYRGLFELSLGRSRRESELAADRLAAGITSGRDIARSLVKVGAYAGFRDRVEADLFSRDERQQSVAIARRVALGFADYAQSDAVHGDLHGSVTPHPFDSHPPLSARLENVNARLAPSDMAQVLLEPVTFSWVSTIQEAEAIEARLWGAYEARFSQAHDLVLAYRYVPSNDEERQHVERHFPPLSFEGKEAGHEATLDFAQVHCPEWEEPVLLSEVTHASTADRMFKKYLDLQVTGEGRSKEKRSLCLSKLKDPDALLRAFEHYLGRCRAMKEHQARSQQAA